MSLKKFVDETYEVESSTIGFPLTDNMFGKEEVTAMLEVIFFWSDHLW
jgi:hypothetical protein